MKKLEFMLGVSFLALVSSTQAQLQWSEYDTSGNLVTANVASGGDIIYGGGVTFTVPAGTERIFMTKSFVPLDLSAASASAKINFTLSASGGLSPDYVGRVIGMGLLNDPGTPASALDDTGYWTDLHTGNTPPSFEMFYRPDTVTTFFRYDSSHKLGAGKISTGYPSNNIPYGMQFQLNENSSASAISIGTSSSSFATAGAAITNGDGAVVIQSYSSANALTTLPTTTFNEFALTFNNGSGSNVTVTVSGLTLVPVNPGISIQPADFNGPPGSTAVFSVGLNPNSASPLSYQWYEIAGGMTNALTDGTTGTGSTVAGSTTNTLTISNAQIADSGYVFVMVSNSYGSATSVPALLNIANDTPPSIFALAWTNANLVAGQDTNVTVRATGVPAPEYYWYDNHSNLLQSGADPTLTLTNLQPADAGIYSVVASNYLGTDSTNFVISLYVAPCISQEPSNVLVHVGDPVLFSVVEGGCADPAPTYQWYKNGSPISGANGPSYSIGAAALGDIGYYSVVLSNPGGSMASTSARLAIYSPTLSATPASPTNGATGLCVDTTLTLTFNQTPFVGNTGEVNIYDASNPGVPVDTIDLGQNNANGVQPHSLFSGDNQVFNYYPVMVNGDTATIYPHGGVLTTNKTYYVTIDPGVIVDADGAYWSGLSSAGAWQFTTKAMGPANPTNLVVAADGSGDFVTVQGAVDSITPGNTNYTVIQIRDGHYIGIVNISGKNDVTFRGQSRTGTIIDYPNNSNIAPGGTTHARMTFKVNANDIAIENLTISNSTPQGGSQAEALMLETGASRFILNNAEVDSRQDTILANVNTSQGYFYNSLIQGNFDYIWGGGNLFFTNCEIRTIPGSSSFNLAAPRTDNGLTGNWPGYNGLLVSNGFSFVRCRLTRADSSVVNCMMSDHNGSQNGLAAWIHCSIDTAGYGNADSTALATQLLWEFGCSNLDNTVALDNTASPFIGFTQLNNGSPELLAAESATNWLNGWQPQLAPNIVTQPTNVIVTAGQTVVMSVVATGIPDPAYQWLRDGTNAPYPGADTATLMIPNAQAADAGTYSVAVSNGSGCVTSDTVSLTVLTPVSPTIHNVTPLGDGNIQFSIQGVPGLSYRVWATTNVGLAPVVGTWALLDSSTFGGSPAVFTDEQATNFPQRFYIITVP